MSEAETGSASSRESIQWAEALRWLAKADEDVAAAELLLAKLPIQAGFHVQQALEKTLKALLVAKAQDIRKTHDITVLAALVRPYWPDLCPDPTDLASLTGWYLSSRCPQFDETDLTTVEVNAALSEVTALLAAVREVNPKGSPKDG